MINEEEDDEIINGRPIVVTTCSKIGQFFKGIAFCICLITYQQASFTSCFVVSTVLVIFLTVALEFLFNFIIPIFSIAFIQALFLISLAHLHTIAQDGTKITNRINEATKKYPVFLGLLPTLLSMGVSVAAIYEVYTFYEKTHFNLKHSKNGFLINYEPQNSSSASKGSGNEVRYLEALVLLIAKEEGPFYLAFIFCFTSVIYNAYKVIERETRLQLLSLTFRNKRKFQRMITGSFLIFQIMLTFGYSIPLIYLLQVSKNLVTSRGIIFFYLSSLAAVIGFLASWLESQSPFPKTRGIGPHYLFENNIKARIAMLKYCLLPFVYYHFFRESKSNDASETQVTHFNPFTLYFSLSILHTVKILSISMFIPRMTMGRLIRIRRRLLRRGHENRGGDEQVGEFIHDEVRENVEPLQLVLTPQPQDLNKNNSRESLTKIRREGEEMAHWLIVDCLAQINSAQVLNHRSENRMTNNCPTSSASALGTRTDSYYQTHQNNN